MTSYLQCRSGLLSARTSNSEQYILTDNLGSTRAVVNPGGVQDYDYGPFGEVQASPAGDELPYRYTGQEQDAVLGVDNYNARLYDPGLRRFYGPDPAAQYPSPYVYVGNDPINNIDPTGTLSAVTVLQLAFWARVTLDLFAGILSDSEFNERFYGSWWASFSDLSNWTQDSVPYKILKNFSRQEAAVIALHYPNSYPIAIPLALLQVYLPVQAAVDREYEGQQKANAIRHISWMCNARRFWFGSDQFAKELGEAHELGRAGSEFDEVADKINNAIALHLASQSGTSCTNLAHDSWRQGFLAKNANFVTGVASLEELRDIGASWEAGLKYLQQTTYAPEFNEENVHTIDWVRRSVQ